jgi:hypothetical protein
MSTANMRGVVPILAVIGAKKAGKRVREKKAAPDRGEERIEEGLIVCDLSTVKGTDRGPRSE